MIPAIIIARGESKRIPRKNLHLFCGLPLILWTIRAAKASQNISEVFVSTDDDEIAGISSFAGAKIIRRKQPSPDEESGIVPTVNAMQEIHNMTGDTVFISCLPTNPVRRPFQIDSMIDLYQTGKYPAVVCGYSPKELVLLERIDFNGGKPVIANINHQYWTFMMGDCVVSINYFQQCLQNVQAGLEFEPSSEIIGVIPLELWQTHDVDTFEQWEAAEHWFQKKLLSEGEDCYERYRKTWKTAQSKD